jgi:hypothetical protein
MVLCAWCVALSSCLKDDDDSSVGSYSDTAIIQFTLGTLNRYTHTTSSKTGNDTILKTSITGSAYKMTIDHMTRRIYNVQPLPVGTDVKHVVCTVNTKNSGVVTVQSMISDSLKFYSSTDSIDFSQPRIFRVYNNTGETYRDYTVSVNVSDSTGIAFGWELVSTDALPDAWTDVPPHMVADGDSVRLIPADSIIGSSASACYMIGRDGRLKASANGGISWQDELTDDADSLLPDAQKAALVCWPYAPASGAEYVLLVGTPQQEDVAGMRVWRKIIFADGTGQWVHMPVDDSNHYPMPRQEWLAMTYYDGKVLAIGSDMVLRQSRDEGITWRTATDYALPETLSGTSATMATDSRGRLWLLTNSGQLWRGYASK